MSLRSLGRWFLAHKQRFAPAVLVAMLVVIGLVVVDAMPRTTEIRYNLGPSHADVVEVRLSYVLKDAEIVGVRFTYPDGAPRSIRHVVELAPGRYEVLAELRGQGEPWTVVRAIHVPADGELRIDLFDEAMASRVPSGPSPSDPRRLG